MAKEQSNKTQAKSREDRLKAALKANLARRKAQARSRGMSEKETADDQGK